MKLNSNWHKIFLIAAAIVAWKITTAPATALQSEITDLDFGTPTDGADSTVNGITYQNESLPIDGFTANSNPWELNAFPTTTTIRRSGGGDAPNRKVVWGERDLGDPVTTVRIGEPSTTEAALQQNNILLGTDNLFVNGDGIAANQSDVERVDLVTASLLGLEVRPDLGVAIFERGATSGHDPFQIAAITAIDGSGTPTAFGNLLSIPQGWGTTSLRPGSRDYTVLNDNDPGGFTNTADLNQEIGGILITLDELQPSGTIFGYSLFGNDVNVNNHNLVNWNSFPPNSTTAQAGGIDLLAANVGITKETPFSFSPALGLVLSGAGWALAELYRKRTKKQKTEVKSNERGMSRKTDDLTVNKKPKISGIDLGLSSLVTVFDGEKI